MKKTLLIVLCMALFFVSTGCKNENEPVIPEFTPKETVVSTVEPTLEPTVEPTVENSAEPTEDYSEALYNWLGYPQVPQCNYLDLIAEGKYYMEYTIYTAGVSSECIMAVDGKNSYTEQADTKAYCIDGMTYSFNEALKIYLTFDYSEIIEQAALATKALKESNQNQSGKVFSGKSEGTIPGLEGVDDNVYEYYEYTTTAVENDPENIYIERFYLKDGDIFALYVKSSEGETVTEAVQVISVMTSELPQGIFILPDLDEYTLYEY